MGQYIHPVELVEENGKPIELKKSLSETEDQLEAGQKICVISTGPGRKIALVINGQNDFSAVTTAPERILGVYAIGHYLVELHRLEFLP